MVNPGIDPVRPQPQAASLSCPSCGAAILLHTQGWSSTVVCASCGSVLDANDPNLAILQRHANAVTVESNLPLGSRGTWSGAQWDVVGFQQVTITVDEVNYSWKEYVCFNPYRGFMYLSEYMGHWNVIEKLRRRPSVQSGTRPTAQLDGITYRHFQSARATTTFALGEFPWELRVGDTIGAKDFVAPPYMLSAEASDGETTWSRGTYTPNDVIRKAFNVEGSWTQPVGIFANQPNPYSGWANSVGKMLAVFVLALAVTLMINLALAANENVFDQSFVFDRADSTTAAIVTAPFELKGHTSRVQVDMNANVNNDWVFFTLSLINEQTGETREFSEQLSYYSGRDEDGNWSEGNKRESVDVPAVPPGRYFLRIAPEGGEASVSSVTYSVRVTRDVPSLLFYLFAALALVVPGLLALIPSASFESRRWNESDYAPDTSSSDDEDE